MNITTRAISNTYTKDFSIEKQVALGIADWEACDDDGRMAYGHSEQEAVENLMKDFNSEYPNLADALIHQRDLYVANALRSILNDVPGKVVAVLGAGHIDGVQKALVALFEPEAAS